MRCLLCNQQKLNPVQHQQWDVAFYQCVECDLIFRDPSSFPGWDEQKSRYDHHNNSPADPNYIAYFKPFIAPLMDCLKTNRLQNGLDWGSGPEPVLSGELDKLGFEVQHYDPIYQPEKPQQQYDFVTCTEVVEHFQEPQKSFEEMLGFVKTGGLFAGMTNFHQGAEKFKDWWYARDATHVCFYSEKTWAWIEKKWRLRCVLLQSPNFIFQKY